MSSTVQITATLPALPEGWSAEKDFKAVRRLLLTNLLPKHG